MLADVAVRCLGVLKLRVGEVVAGPHHAALAASARPETPSPSTLRRIGRCRARPAGRWPSGRRPSRRSAGLADELDPAAVGVEQAHRLVERALQDVARVADGGDARRDLAQRALCLDPALELLVQAGVAEHDGRLAGQRAEELAVVGVERVGTRASRR